MKGRVSEYYRYVLLQTCSVKSISMAGMIHHTHFLPHVLADDAERHFVMESSSCVTMLTTHWKLIGQSP